MKPEYYMVEKLKTLLRQALGKANYLYKPSSEHLDLNIFDDIKTILKEIETVIQDLG